MPLGPSGDGNGHRPRSPSPSPNSFSPSLSRRRSPLQPKPSAINVPCPNQDQPSSRILSQSLGRATLTSHRRAAIDEWMRGLASPSPHKRADTPASVVSSTVTSDSASSLPLRSRSRTISTIASKPVNTLPPTHTSPCPSHSALPPSAPSLPTASVSARAAHFNALARSAATVPTPSPMQANGRREPGFARPTRSSSAKIAKAVVPIPGVSTGAASEKTCDTGSPIPPPPCTPATTAPSSPNSAHAELRESEPLRKPEAAPSGLRPLLLQTGSAPERVNLTLPQSTTTVRTRLSLVPYKVDDTAADNVHPIAPSHPASPTGFKHHRRHSSLIYKKSEPSAAFPISPSSTSSQVHPSDPEGFLEGCRSDPGLRDRRHDTIVSGNLERRESILRSIVRVENREREVREDMERRGYEPYEPVSGGLRRLSLQGRPARRRSTPCMPSYSPIEASPVSILSSSRKFEASQTPQQLEFESPQMDSLQVGAEDLLTALEPQATRETDISTAPTTLGLTGTGLRSSLLRPTSISTTTTDDEPRVRFATPDDMRAQFRRQIHRESTFALLTGPQRSRPPVEILDHNHLAVMISKQEYAATETPATSVTTSIASAESLPRYRRHAKPDPDPDPDYVASGSDETVHAVVRGRRRQRRSTFCGAGGAELDKLAHDEHRFIAIGDVDPLDHLLPEPQEGPSLFTTLGRWFCPVDGS
ncbi:hypothetical protein CspeluHIS016_0114410 [Cutaneotrichosporon spelunceum]|uniref:Uncharacterized protein n=1 Tax=Cutaneotrichosporon spelunceum TaxID=1672016 RepID=A0AAD3TQA2_9TREE|nr:hypothetical protein CspeluHIS016_0114410 [Cutaneotrichosporon spelunceum]